MKNGSDDSMDNNLSYKVIWSPRAKDELQATYHFLESHWSQKHLKSLLQAMSQAISDVIRNLQQNPKLYPVANVGVDYPLAIHKVNIQRFNSLYYAIDEENLQINILSFFSNRQSPNKLQF